MLFSTGRGYSWLRVLVVFSKQEEGGPWHLHKFQRKDDGRNAKPLRPQTPKSGLPFQFGLPHDGNQIPSSLWVIVFSLTVQGPSLRRIPVVYWGPCCDYVLFDSRRGSRTGAEHCWGYLNYSFPVDRLVTGGRRDQTEQDPAANGTGIDFWLLCERADGTYKPSAPVFYVAVKYVLICCSCASLIRLLVQVTVQILQLCRLTTASGNRVGTGN